MRKTKKILSLALASTMVLSLAACGGGSTSTPTTAAETTTAAAADADTTGETTAAEAEGEGLVKWVDDGEGNAMTAPGQAESWEKVVNDDGTVTYTMKLRDGIKWSDGKEVTAGDFEYSWKRLANPETAADYCYMIDMVQNYAGIANSESDPDTLGIKAIDDKTLEIVLSYDCPYFEEIMAFPATFPVRQDLVEGNDEWTYDVATYVSNGPYKMKEWSHNAYILAEKNENYYDFANLGPDTIRFTLLDDANAMLAAYKSGELDFIEELPPDEMANYLASGELTVADYIGTYYVCFNVEDEIFSNPLIRKAFSLAIDRNYIVENVSQAGEPAIQTVKASQP